MCSDALCRICVWSVYARAWFCVCVACGLVYGLEWVCVLFLHVSYMCVWGVCVGMVRVCLCLVCSCVEWFVYAVAHGACMCVFSHRCHCVRKVCIGSLLYGVCLCACMI